MSTPQPIKQLTKIIESLATEEHCLFTLSDLRAALLNISPGAFKVLISRAEKSGFFKRICRGIYLYPKVEYQRGLLLFHVAARLRADEFNYISFETALSDAGVISQVPINWITLMSTGRSNVIRCSDWGTIEFVHTNQKPDDLKNQLVYDKRCHFWRASVALALRDMKATRRSLDLIDWRVVNEPV
jgi:Transcriptional regulator, AbiEi antitoxin